MTESIALAIPDQADREPGAYELLRVWTTASGERVALRVTNEIRWRVGDCSENDTAVDWTYSLEKSNDLSFIEATLDRVIAVGPGTLVRADDGEQAVAAADTLARLLGRPRPSDAYTDAVDAWVGSHQLTPPPALLVKARAALARITTPESELLDCWNEAESGGDWVDLANELSALLQ